MLIHFDGYGVLKGFTIGSSQQSHVRRFTPAVQHFCRADIGLYFTPFCFCHEPL